MTTALTRQAPMQVPYKIPDVMAVARPDSLTRRRNPLDGTGACHLAQLPGERPPHKEAHPS